MKIAVRFLFAVFLSVLYVHDVMAEECKPGCFCPGTGIYSQNINAQCRPARKRQTTQNTCTAWYGSDSSALISTNCDANTYSGYNLYYIENFSELYFNDTFGFYGFVGDDFIYVFAKNPNNQAWAIDMLACPESYPNSESGAKSLYECFKYGADGTKIYYKNSNTNINNNTNNNNTNIISGNSDVASVQILVRNLQEALSKTMQDLQNLENKLNNKPVSLIAGNNITLKPKAAIPQRTKKSLNVPAKNFQSRSAVSKSNGLTSVGSVSVEPETVRDVPKIKRPSKYKERNQK